MVGNPTHECARDSARPQARNPLVTGLRRLAAALERGRQRRALKSLPDHMLHDLGLTRRDVEAECRRSFWR
jgi:uncharacterized protein YjiS (DUF1127 family)